MAEDKDEFNTQSAPLLSRHSHTNHLSLDKLLLDAARNDNLDQLFELFGEPAKFDINHQDGWVIRLKPSSFCHVSLMCFSLASATQVRLLLTSRTRNPVTTSGCTALHYA